MQRKMSKFYKGTSVPKDDGSLVMDYELGDVMLGDRKPLPSSDDFEFEEISRREEIERRNNDIDEWLSSKRNIQETKAKRLLSESDIDNRHQSRTDYISFAQKKEQSSKKVDAKEALGKENSSHNKTALEQLQQIRKESGPVKPFASRAEEVQYQFSEKKRREEIRKFTQSRQYENKVKSQKDEDRKRTEELRKLFDLDDGDETPIDERDESEKFRSINNFQKSQITNSQSQKYTSNYENNDDDDDFVNIGVFDESKIKRRTSEKSSTSKGAFADEHHHHSSHHSSHKRHKSKAINALRVIRNVVLILMAVVLGLAGIGYATYRLMDYTGGLSLYQRTIDQAPDMSQATLYEEVAIDDNMMPLTASSWQPGWIRYDGITYAYNSNLLTFLVLGIDSYEEVHEGEDGMSGGQSDAMFFLVLDPISKNIKIIAINRNTMTDIDVYNEEGVYVGTGEAQICLQHGFGNGLEQSCERTVKTVKNLFHELPINGYISINMGAIPTVNETVGGVTLKVMYDLPSYGQYRSLKKGETVTLSGDDAYWYTQHRDINVDWSANERLERQLQYLIEFVPALQQRVKEDPKSIASIYSALSPYMVTDIELNEAVYLGNEACDYSFNSANIYQMKGESIIGRSGFEEFIYDEEALYDLIIDVFYTEVDA